jgi:hypothetical protein
MPSTQECRRTLCRRLAFVFGNRPTALRQRKKHGEMPEYARLRTEVENVLGNLAQVTTLLLELFRSDNSEKYKHLDKELELTVGEKERAVGLCASTSESTSADRQSGPRHVASTMRQSHCLALPSRQSSLRTTHKCVLILRPGLERNAIFCIGRRLTDDLGIAVEFVVRKYSNDSSPSGIQPLLYCRSLYILPPRPDSGDGLLQ